MCLSTTPIPQFRSAMENIDEELKKKIESTKFVFMVAQPGVGKTFSGDYFEVVRGWKHIDGDVIYKKASSNPEYMEASQQFLKRGEYAAKAVTDKKWAENESWKNYIKLLADLALESAKDSDTVVVTHGSYFRQQRAGFRQHLFDAGARDVSTVFLNCYPNPKMQALWERSQDSAKQFGITVEELYEHWGVEGIVDYDSFVKSQSKFHPQYHEPDESEQVYKVVDVSARDVTVLDKLDEAFGIENESRGDMTYEDMVQKIRSVDKRREKAWKDSLLYHEGEKKEA